MTFPEDMFDINTNMPATEFLQVYNDLRPMDRSLVADVGKVDARNWFLNYNGKRYEITADEFGMIDGMYRVGSDDRRVIVSAV